MEEKIKVNNVIDNSDMIAVTCDIADMIMDAKYPVSYTHLRSPRD